MTAHTPGPWRPSLYSRIFGCVVVAKRGIVVASILGDKATSDANARLIACAPELLAAVEKTVQTCSVCRGNGKLSDTHDLGECPASADLRALIVRGRGEP